MRPFKTFVLLRFSILVDITIEVKSSGAVLITELNEAAVAPGTKEKVDEVEAKLASGELHVFDTSTWTVGGETLDTYKKDGSDIEYISDGYFHESEFGSAPSFDILIDGITTIDN